MDGRDEKGRFANGNAGGPGRPKDGLSLVKEIIQQLGEPYPGTDATVARVLVRKYIADAIDGLDMPGRRDLIDRIDGKAKQPIEHSGDVTGRLQIVRHLDDGEAAGE